MGVSNMHDMTAMNIRMLSELRFNHETNALAAAAVKVLAKENAPVQYNNLTGAATIRLPLAARDGTMWVITNGSGAFALTVTDDAGSPATVGTLATLTAGIFMKKGSTYVLLLEGATQG